MSVGIENPKDFGERLQTIREAGEVSQKFASHYCDHSVQIISDVENGQGSDRARVFVAVAILDAVRSKLLDELYMLDEGG